MDRAPGAPAGARLPVILNAGSGGGGYVPADLERLAEIFAEHGLEADIHLATDREVAERTREVLRARPPVVVAGGGDGTVSTVAAHLRGSGTALAVLPLGTLNHFARDLGIPTDIREAVATIARGRRVAVDLGEVNDRTFVNNASLGIYPDIVRDRVRQQRRLGRGKWWAMTWATLSALRRFPFLSLELEVDGSVSRCRSPFVFIGNNDYTMEGFDIGTRSSLRDGRLSIYTTRRRSRWGLVELALRALFGRLSQADDFAMANATRLTIDSRRKRLYVATDGEVSAMETPLAFRVLPGALEVIVPEA